jgi:hypothetical protein
MKNSAAAHWIIVLGSTLLAATMFAWVAVVNGYPLLFKDSGRYIDGGILHYIPNQSPIFYGIFMIPLHLDGVSLWPVIGAQCLLLAYIVRVTLRLFDLCDERVYLVLSAFLGVFTDAPWFTALIMPDFFTPICVLAMFALFCGWQKFAPLERTFLVVLTVGALATHVTHILIGLSLSALFLLLHVFGRHSLKASLAAVLVLPLVALGGIVGMNVIAKGRPLITMDGSVFLLARTFADGPAYDYLSEHCGEKKWHLCATYRQWPRNTNEILWNPSRSLWSGASPDEVRTEAADIVHGTIAEYPGQVLLAGLRNTLEQLVTFRAGVDFDVWPDASGSSWVATVIKRHFPQEFGQFMGSLQWRRALDTNGVNYLYSSAAVLSFLGILALMFAARVEVKVLQFLLVVAVAMIVNAGATGAFSGVYDRYQARIVWLIPFAFAISMLMYQRQPNAWRSKQSVKGAARQVPAG